MRLGSEVRAFALLTLILLLTVGLSNLRDITTRGGAETAPPSGPPAMNDSMTVAEFGRANGLGRPLLREIFGLSQAAQLQKPLSDFGLTPAQVELRVSRARALENEGATKDWAKIRIKFALWILFLAGAFVILRRRLITGRVRVSLYALGVLVFGVILGADPSPMGTVKDAIILYGAFGVIFKPRLIALGIFLVMTLAANKFICSWGCQFGVLQDLVLRIRTRGKGVPAPWKPPFVLTNGVRILFFAAMTVIAFAWAFDIVAPIDPFKIYKPLTLGLAGIVFLALLMLAALRVYRPWCHFFCPFGLVAWLVEKVSIFKIKVDYGTCIACESCARACPSTVMGAILKRDRVIPDCFACGTCIEVCPVGAVSLGAGRRARPPEGKFDAREEQLAHPTSPRG